MSPTKAAVDSLMTTGQSLLQGLFSRPQARRSRPWPGVEAAPAVAEVKPEMMQVDEVPRGKPWDHGV